MPPSIKMFKVLIISVRFPPANSIGAVRMNKFAKYLPDFGWQPYVLTLDRSGEDIGQPLAQEIDESFVTRTPYIKEIWSYLAQKPAGHASTGLGKTSQRELHRSPSEYLRKILGPIARPVYSLPLMDRLLFDPVGWYPYAVKAGLAMASKERPDMIFSSFPPIVAHPVAARIHSVTGIPWVAEFRDPWSQDPYRRHTQPYHFIDQLLEKWVLRGSSLLVGLSDPFVPRLTELHSKRVVMIPNGFDETDYALEVPPTPHFTLTYTGNITPGRRDPTALFKAIASLTDEGKIVAGDIDIRFFGQNVTRYISPIVKKYALESWVKVYDAVSFEESIRKQKESTALLLLEWNDASAAQTLTGKVFEYLGASRPILAIAYPGGEIDRLLAKTGSGVLTIEVSRIKEVLMTWLDEFKRSGAVTSFYQPQPDEIALYSRREQARKMAEAFEEVLLPGAPGST